MMKIPKFLVDRFLVIVKELYPDYGEQAVYAAVTELEGGHIVERDFRRDWEYGRTDVEQPRDFRWTVDDLKERIMNIIDMEEIDTSVPELVIE